MSGSSNRSMLCCGTVLSLESPVRVLCYSVKSGISGQPETDFRVLCYRVESGISGQPEVDFRVWCHSV